jgi:protein tyrosine phosphatase (PTP) superfamily phosphohydrolase (DUF442 family)
MKRFSLPLCLAVLFVSIAMRAQADAPAVKGPIKIDSTLLPNAYRLTDKVLSGGQPQGEVAFKQLKELGVRTVISVDGAKPDVELANKYGLRYVHLPHGYDGIPGHRLLELTKAVRELPGPIYIHCHHGKHRSPAASAAACISAGFLNNDQGLGVLATAGTSKDYRGLFQTVREAKPIDAKESHNLKVEFKETVAVPPMADAMIGIEHTHDHLKTIAGAGWKATEKHADIDPPHEALLLREHFTELLRTDETKKQPAAFRRLLEQSETEAKGLEELLRSSKPDKQRLDAQFARITARCTSCHQTFRDIPLEEKAAAK